MVAYPVILRSEINERVRQTMPDLEEVVRHDAETIIREAAVDVDTNDVSAHALIEAFTRSWKRLRLADFRIWGSNGR